MPTKTYKRYNPPLNFKPVNTSNIIAKGISASWFHVSNKGVGDSTKRAGICSLRGTTLHGYYKYRGQLIPYIECLPANSAYISYGPISVNATSNFTIVSLIRCNDNASYPIGTRNNGTAQGVEIRPGSSGSDWRMRVRGNSGLQISTGALGLTLGDGEFHLTFQVVNLTAGTITFYVEVDGVLTSNTRSITDTSIIHSRSLYAGERAGSYTAVDVAFVSVYEEALSLSLIEEIVTNPWQILEPIKDPLFVGIAIAGNVTLLPGTGAFSVAGQDANVAQDAILTPANGALSVAGQTAIVNLDRYVLPDTDTISINGQDVTVAVLVSINPAAGTISIAGQDVDLTEIRIIAPTSAILNIDGQAVTVSAVFVVSKKTGFIYKLVGPLVDDLIEELM